MYHMERSTFTIHHIIGQQVEHQIYVNSATAPSSTRLPSIPILPSLLLKLQQVLLLVLILMVSLAGIEVLAAYLFLGVNRDLPRGRRSIRLNLFAFSLGRRKLLVEGASIRGSHILERDLFESAISLIIWGRERNPGGVSYA